MDRPRANGLAQRRVRAMSRAGQVLAAAVGLILAIGGGTATAQKQGGILRIYHRDSPASMSIHEEGTNSVIAPMMPVFNNLVLFDQHVPQNSLASIVPELATSWVWNEDGTALTFRLRQGVKWHDGKPFTAADVKCTWDLLLDHAKDKFRINYRASWYFNLADVTVSGDDEATFHLKRPQPSFLMILASGVSPVYPCHVTPAQMRQHPIGTGPFKFVEYRPNQDIKLAKNPDYWKPGLPYLDGIEFTIIPNRSTAILAFVAGQFDMTFPYEVSIPLLKDVKDQAPQAICQVGPATESTNIVMSRKIPPFDKPELRRAIALSIDRKAFIDIIGEGQGDIGGTMQPLPEGFWGMPREMLEALPIYGPDVEKNRAEARAIMQQLGYGPDKHLPVKVSARNLAHYREPASLLIDQLKSIWIDGELELIETANWIPKLTRKDFVIALSTMGRAVDEPDTNFYSSYSCSSQRNYTGFCSPEFEKLVDQQSDENDIEKRKRLVWQLERVLAEEAVRPQIYHLRLGTCWHPQLKNLTLMTNSIYNGWRMEDVWLDK
jgi:peptide/nickel transport system substrate-binding protein